MDKIWMIVNVTEYLDESCTLLPDDHAPRYIHEHKDDAEDELLRLKYNFTDLKFVLMEAVSFVEKDRDGVCRLRDFDDE